MPGPALQDLTNKPSISTSGSIHGQLIFLGGTKLIGDKTTFLYKSLASRSAGQHLTQQVLPLDQPLLESQLQDARLVVLVCTDDKSAASPGLVSKKALRAIYHAVKQQDCSLLVLLGCCKGAARKRINLLLEKFQMEASGAAVISSSPQRYLHPQEVLLIDCILNRRLQQRVGQVSTRHIGESAAPEFQKPVAPAGTAIIFPYGTSIRPQAPAFPIVSSGPLAFPTHHPVGAVWQKEGAGRVAVLGSHTMLADEWISREQNSLLADALLEWLLPGGTLKLEASPYEDDLTAHPRHIPDTANLAEQFQACLQEEEPAPSDWTKNFHTELYGLDLGCVPKVAELRKKLEVEPGPLQLIRPKFETPMPPLTPALFLPAMPDPEPPCLELFDLDAEFEPAEVQLGSQPSSGKSAKAVLKALFTEFADLKGQILRSP
ncbi:hypothetical protein WJX84_008304 [Apatococcus fuscideae]|uniref:Uncharacterized protein n=1 Tax=Apatococcus fuscideae TaxID=2026836 RepID=A0AAW1SS24_9CHLO